MAIKEIVEHPSPILLKKCKEVVKFDKKLAELLDDMYETMKEVDGVGLAAPQIGESIQVAIVEVDEEQEVIELINPVVTAVGGSEIEIEGCLSFPGVYGEVERPFYVKVEAQERDGSLYELEAEGYEARAILHEIDHLNGVLFDSKIIRIVDLEELEALEAEEIEMSREGEEV
ncbi:peptide deformylase [Sporosarcina sp. Marseille-Q4063]|uniref:peptide deformylase n=1 Tax=Sporosarcina sp. Marseille-Q4063 TaxID=2810514 RepID=UPI001BAF714C|nr:peptide deformylase [Sporosarcina sp. Marseille-Q4063]QUW21829.1 peptide deformylase [Sporosarcina sp. Marseille-Q4063]